MSTAPAQYVVDERDVTTARRQPRRSSQVRADLLSNPDNGVLSIVMQTPQYQIDSLSGVQTLRSPDRNPPSPILAHCDIKRTIPAPWCAIRHQSMVQIYATRRAATSRGRATCAGDC